MRFCLVLLSVVMVGFGATDAELERQFAASVKPFVSAYCVQCHAGAQAAAQFDLKPYGNVAGVVRDHPRWALMAERVASGSMPPKGMKQPPDAERAAVVAWIEAVLAREAEKNAGDPGVVLARRLSNAEYDNTLRDLTGVDFRLGREFPVDPTNQAGFDNTGESLTMSPALFKKYLDAARVVANHVVFKLDGLAFATHPMLAESDREKYTIQKIVEFYERQPTDYAAYFEAAWRYKHKLASSLDAAAREAKVSPKYLPLVWGILEETKEDVGPVAKLQAIWRRLPRPEHKQPDLVKEGCGKMRDYVVRVRKLTAMQFRSPKVQGLSGTSQPLMNWKLRAYAANRRKFDTAALQVEGEPPPEAPPMVRASGVPTEDQVALRNAALAVRSRFGDPDLLVPVGERARYEASFAKFAEVFPDAFYIKERGRFYPDDSEDKGRLLSAGFHNVMGYFRDDTPLVEMVLDDAGRRELDQLWMEFDTIADQTTRTYVQFFFNQSGEIDGRGRESGSFRPGDRGVTETKTIFGIRDTYLAKADTAGEELARQAIREHFARVDAAIRAVEKARLDAEPKQMEGFLRLAARAYRRPLQEREKQEFLAFYKTLREKNALTHEDAVRDLVALVLVSPDFTYRLDLKPAPLVSKTAVRPAPALASRLSYLLWASMPDERLLAADVQRPEVMLAETRRMLKDGRARALATEFAGNWLGFRRFEEHASVDKTRFPQFTNELRQAMFEEPVRFIDDLIRNGGSMMDLIYGEHTFVNGVLARHYGMDDVRVAKGAWKRVDNARRYGRGGLLPMAALMTKSSPGLRTSPVKRGYWVARTLLGEHIPPPPAAVPELPDDESKMDLPLRQMLAKHRENASCASCHQRFDGFGLAFEGYGPVGEKRSHDLAGRAVDASAEFPGGGQGTGLDDLVAHIKAKREKDFVNHLCRQTVTYALGRGLLLSDEPLIAKAREAFVASGYKFGALVETVVTSRQFLEQRFE